MWKESSRLPFGRQIFSRAIGLWVPYSGSIGAVIEELSPGRCRLSMTDRRSIRNHLKSIHAMALANFGELTTGLAVVSALSSEQRAILTGYQIQYLKKSRGTLNAVCVVPPIPVEDQKPLEVQADIKNGDNEVVAQVKATWLIGSSASRAR